MVLLAVERHIKGAVPLSSERHDDLTWLRSLPGVSFFFVSSQLIDLTKICATYPRMMKIERNRRAKI